jgi:hypothetical protein
MRSTARAVGVPRRYLIGTPREEGRRLSYWQFDAATVWASSGLAPKARNWA